MSSTQTNSTAAVKKHELSECLLEGLHGSTSSSSSGIVENKKLFKEVKSCEAATFVKFVVPVFEPWSH